MTPERWSRVQAVFETVADLPDSERDARLTQECGDDDALRREVLSLLAADAQTGAMLDAPPQTAPAFLDDAPLPPGTKLGEYVLGEELGEGGFGRVYRAVHPVIRKHAAVKVLYARFSASEAHAGRFINEARTVNEIGHPDIIDIFAFGETPQGCLYFVMELVDAGTLEDRLKDGPLRLAEALPILRRLAAAVDAAHARGVIHRDLKPANILLVDGPDGPAPKLLDFGIAKLRPTETTDQDPAQAPTQPKRTADGQILGTPAYMSPEQARGVDVGPATDVYALGVVAYQILTGRVPFAGKTPLDTVMQHLQDPPVPPSQHVPGLPVQLDDAIAAMLAKDAGDRPRNCMTAIEGFEGPVDAIAATDTNGGRRWLRAVAFGAAAIVAGALTWATVGRTPETARAHSTEAAVPAPAPRDDAVAAVATPPPPPTTRPAKTARPPTPTVAPEPLPAAVAVAVEFVGAPKATTLLDADDRRLGTIPGAIELPPSDAPVQLIARKRGYKDQPLSVLPAAGLRVEVKMRRRGPPKLNEDLESPFPP